MTLTGFLGLCITSIGHLIHKLISSNYSVDAGAPGGDDDVRVHVDGEDDDDGDDDR